MTAGEPFCILCGNRPCTCQKVFLGGYDVPNINTHITINGKGSKMSDSEMILMRLSSIEQLLKVVCERLYEIGNFQRGDS